MQRSLFALSSLALIAWSSAAFAQSQAENMAAARSLGIAGVELADQGKCKEALEKLERAEALYHAPSILGRLGECQVEVGKIVLGTENLNRVVREQLPANAPQAFVIAQERAKKVLERALPRIAYLTVRVEPQTVGAQVTVGGTPVPAALLGAERPTDPGVHEVVANAAGYNAAKTSVTLAEGSHQQVSLVLTVDPNAAAAVPAAVVAPVTPAAAPTQPDAAAPASSGPNRTAAYVAFGVGGAGLLTGTITGILAMTKEGSLECPDNHCPPAEHDALDSAKTLATISTIGFGVGLAGAATGVVLWMTGSKAEASVGSVRARPWIAGHTMGLEGSF